MDYDEILKKIIRRYGAETENIRATQLVESRLERHTATYADAEKCAQEIGQALTEAFREYLPEALTDGKLYRAAAEVLVEQPMKHAGRDVAEIAEKIQRQMNENAGIGINPVIPEINQDQINGIITGICNAESYEAGKELFFDQVENCMEGYVDDFVRENADFQYEAGMSPTVTRIADSKCCKWCSGLSGTYDYEDVRDKGNDVWRRHRNCHCRIEFNPGRGRKRRANRQKFTWTDRDEADRIAYEQVKHELNPIERGYEEAKVYGKTWQEGSLQETVGKFAPNASPESDKTGRKIGYKGDRYIVVYDTGGNYFTIQDLLDRTKRPFVDMNGNKILNVTENGRQRGATKDEYRAMSHFRNTDQEGKH